MFVVCHHSIKGFGLGLYEARVIARRLNGNIDINSRKTKVTEFRILIRDNHMNPVANLPSPIALSQQP